MNETTFTDEGAPSFETLRDLVIEVGRARAKFPSNQSNFLALLEEVGELAEAILQRDGKRIEAEARQVACVAVRIIEEGDRLTSSDVLWVADALGTVAKGILEKNPAIRRPALARTVETARYLCATGGISGDDEVSA